MVWLVSASPPNKEPLEPEDAVREDAVLDELEQRFDDAYDENGVDRSLIRWSLSRTPTERVVTVEETLNALATLKRATPWDA